MQTRQQRAEALEARAQQAHPETWRPDQGEPTKLIGTVTGYDTADTAYGEKTILVLEDTAGKAWSVWLIHSALVSAVARERPKPGELVLIQYQGRKKSGNTGRQYHAYRVEVDGRRRCRTSTSSRRARPIRPTRLPLSATSRSSSPRSSR